MLWSVLSQERLRNAAKAQLRRMMKEKHKRVGLNVSAWVREEWAKRDKGEMAQLLMDANWDKAWWYMYIIDRCIFEKSVLMINFFNATW